MKRLRRFFSTMGGRLYLILLLGMLISAILATLLVYARREQQLMRQVLSQTADRLQGYVDLLDGSGTDLRGKLLELGGPGVHVQQHEVAATRADTEFQALLRMRSGPLATARVERGEPRSCIPELPEFARELEVVAPSRRASSAAEENRDRAVSPPVCRVVELRLSDGTPLRLALMTPEVVRSNSAAFDPLFLALLAVAMAALAYLVTRIATAPLQRLADAATRLGHDLKGEPLALAGTVEVRSAAQAFNAMQYRLQRHMDERMQMLAAITHDLQTPLTRLRLRLENVEDEVLRERLVADLAAMQALIREGLELARSAESAEEPMALDLGSLLESLVEDAIEAGDDAAFEAGADVVLMLRPLAMRRLFSNLLDNAVKYGTSARVSLLRRRDGGVEVRVRDRGPGLPEAELEHAFDPFVRMETSRSRETGGAGLGLTIARVLAEKDGASIRLRNDPHGGLEALVSWDAPVFARPRGA